MILGPRRPQDPLQEEIAHAAATAER
jgi:hypothetical protein